MKFTDSHEWIEINKDVAVVGITQYAQKELGDIVYIEFPQVGKTLRAGQEACVLESTKAAADIYAPLSGEVIAVNPQLQASVALINTYPQSEGWIFKMRLEPGQTEEFLLSQAEYEALIST